MGGVATSRAFAAFSVGLSDCLLVCDTGRDQIEHTSGYGTGIESLFTPPGKVAEEDILSGEPLALSETLGEAEGHLERSSNPVPRCESEQNAPHPIARIDAHIPLNRSTHSSHTILLRRIADATS